MTTTPLQIQVDEILDTIGQANTALLADSAVDLNPLERKVTNLFEMVSKDPLQAKGMEMEILKGIVEGLEQLEVGLNSQHDRVNGGSGGSRAGDSSQIAAQEATNEFSGN